MTEFDLIVIGAGPGGYVSAIRASQMGLTVALIEKDSIGGTCLNRGCIPTKSLFYSAKTLKKVKEAQIFGVEVTGVKFNLKKAMERKNAVVEDLVKGVASLLKGNKVTVFKGTGFIKDKNTVIVKNGGDVQETLQTKNIIIATGSEPKKIESFNIDYKNILTSTEALNLEKVPSSIAVIGAGVMGSEFASIYSKFGSKVTLIEALEDILLTEDKTVRRYVEKSFKNNDVDILKNSIVKGIKVIKDNEKVEITLEDGAVIETEKVIVAIGRSFNSAHIGIENTNIELSNELIKVDEFLETNEKNIYAIGDVTGGMLLAHVASMEGMVAVKNIIAGRHSSNKNEKEEMDYSVVPSAIFTDPEIASVGLREKDCKDRAIDVNIGRFPYMASGKAMAMAETEGMVQIITDKNTDQVLGASIVGANATDLIGELSLAVKKGLTAKDIIDTIHAHPTLPEMVQEAMEDTLGLAIHKIGRRRK